jgi:hypothetical protein
MLIRHDPLRDKVELVVKQPQQALAARKIMIIVGLRTRLPEGVVSYMPAGISLRYTEYASIGPYL